MPLISAGGSALIMTLLAIGVVLSFARELPGKGRPGAARDDLAPQNGVLR